MSKKQRENNKKTETYIKNNIYCGVESAEKNQDQTAETEIMPSPEGNQSSEVKTESIDASNKTVKCIRYSDTYYTVITSSELPKIKHRFGGGGNSERGGSCGDSGNEVVKTEEDNSTVSAPEENPLAGFTRVPGGMLNEKTGELVPLESKYDSLKTVQKSYNQEHRRLSYDICHSSPRESETAATVVTLTMDHDCTYEEFKRLLKNYLQKLEYHTVKEFHIDRRDFKFEYFIEGNLNRLQEYREHYHVHFLLWFEGNDLALKEEFQDLAKSLWQHGAHKCSESICSESKLEKVLCYLTNYSGENEKSLCKQETLKYIAPGAHLHRGSKNIRKLPSAVEFTPSSHYAEQPEPTLSSKRAFHGTEYKFETFIIGEQPENVAVDNEFSFDDIED